MQNLMQLMEWDLGINKGKGKGGKGKGKGKGKGETKGKGAAKGEGKAKGKGKANWEGNPVSPSSRSPAASSCTRCGKDGHTAAECYHKDKVCDNCGKKGHLKAVCWLEGQATESEEPKTVVTMKVAPWTCMTCFEPHEDPYLRKCPKCKTARIHPNSERDETEVTEKTMIAKNIVRAMEGGDGGSTKEDSGDGQEDKKREKEDLENLERLITAAQQFGMLSAVKDAEEKKEAILKKKKDRDPTVAAMVTAKTAKDVLAEKMRLLKQKEDRAKQLDAKAQEAVAARIKQAEEKQKAIKREKARHEAAMAALDEEYAAAEKFQTRRLEAAKEDIQRVEEQYQKDLQKIDAFLLSHPGLTETPPPQETKEKPPAPQPPNYDDIMQHLSTDSALTGQTPTPELIAKSVMDLMEKLKQKAVETDAKMEQAGATKRAASPLPEKPAKKPATDGQKEDDECSNL